MHQHIIQHLPAHIVEVHIHTLGAYLFKFLPYGLCLVVDGGVSPDILDVLALIVGSCDTTYVASFAFGQLHYDLADCSSSCRYHHDVVLLKLPNLIEAEIGSQTRNSEDSQKVLIVRVIFRQDCQLFLFHNCVFLPPNQASHHIPHLNLVGSRVDDNTHAASSHHISWFHGRQVAGHPGNPDPHRGINRHIHILDDHTALRDGIDWWRGAHFDLKHIGFLSGVLVSGDSGQPDDCVEIDNLFVRHRILLRQNFRG